MVQRLRTCWQQQPYCHHESSLCTQAALLRLHIVAACASMCVCSGALAQVSVRAFFPCSSRACTYGTLHWRKGPRQSARRVRRAAAGAPRAAAGCPGVARTPRARRCLMFENPVSGSLRSCPAGPCSRAAPCRSAAAPPEAPGQTQSAAPPAAALRAAAEASAAAGTGRQGLLKLPRPGSAPPRLRSTARLSG